MTTQISVSNDGTKTYTVLKGIPRSVKPTRGATGEKSLKYPFLLTMEVDDCIIVDTKDEAQKMQRAANQKPYRLSTSIREIKATLEGVDPSNVGKFFFFNNGPLKDKESDAK